MASIDYQLCIICQENKDVKDLKYPCRSKGTINDVLQSFRQFLENYHRRVELEDVDYLLSSDISAETLYMNNACWHGKCKRPFKKDALDR